MLWCEGLALPGEAFVVQADPSGPSPALTARQLDLELVDVGVAPARQRSGELVTITVAGVELVNVKVPPQLQRSTVVGVRSGPSWMRNGRHCTRP